jgi:predicted secreted protein
MSNATSSFGTLLKIGNGGTSETFATIAEVRDIKGPNLKLNTKEVTSHSSTDGWKEFIGTLLEGGEVTFQVNWLPADATHSYSAGLVKDLVGRTKRNFQIVFPSASPTTWSFTALVTGFNPGALVDGELQGDVTLQVTGKPTLA